MKKILLSLVLSVVAIAGANAMSFSRAQAEALYLTDKMAYELNLNDQQYNDAYEINLDYFLRMESPSDVYGYYYNYRLSDLRCILHDWQYSLLLAADYFLRPITWRAGSWFFPIYSYYGRGSYFYGRPRVWVTYRGGHSRFYHSAGYYMHRRPVWNGGLRGRDMYRPGAGIHSSHGRGYHFDTNGRMGGGSNRHYHSGSAGYGTAPRQHGGNGSHGIVSGQHNPGSSSRGTMSGQHNPGSSSRGIVSGQHDHSRGSYGSGSPAARGNSFGSSSTRTDYGRGSDMTRSYSGGSSRGGGMTRSSGAGFSGGSRGGSMSHSSGTRGGGSSRSGRR